MLFNRKKKLGNSSGSGEFDEFDLDMDMEDDYEASPDRKSSVKSYARNYYENKLRDKGEQKRLLKSAMPGSYSTSIDLASDLKEDLSSIRYDVQKEWDKQKAPLKKLLKSNDSMLKLLRLKKLSSWANEEERGRYSEEPGDQDEANVQNLLSSFSRGNRQSPDQQLKNQEREKNSEFRTKSLLTQMRGTASLNSILTELKTHTSYQDQVTYQYQQKSLEFLIRNFVENKKQTEILHTYKEESMAELKEIHKNTGLPEAVKINQSELAGQIFKERMLGSAVGWFDGKMGTLRKRVTNQVRGRLLEMTRSFGSTIEQFNEGIEAGRESGTTPMRMLMESLADSQLAKPYNYITGKVGDYARNRLGQNTKINRFGKTMQALTANGAGLVNNALLSGNTGNKILDGLVGVLGLRSAAVQRSNTVRGSLAQNLDVAQHMTKRFTETVERVIPGLLGLIYKEQHLMRTGKQETEYKPVHWDWTKEEFIDEDESKLQAFAKVFKKENVEQMNLSMERVLRHFDPKMIISSAARKELRKWIFDKVRKSILPTLYGLMLEIHRFKEPVKSELILMCEYAGPIFEEDLEDDNGGLIAEGQLISARPDTYGKWMKELAPLIQDLAGRNLFDLKEIMQIAQTAQGKQLEKLGLLRRTEDGSLEIDEDFESNMLDRSSDLIKYRKQGKLKADGSRSVKNRKGKVEERTNWEFDGDEEALENLLGNEISINKKNAFAKSIQRWVTQDTLNDRDKRSRKHSLQELMTLFPSMTASEIKRGLKAGTLKFAAGGRIPSFAGGGDTGNFAIDKGMKVEVHGGEFVSDNQTTEQNKTLLNEMNRLKAKVINKDGSINPIYYKAFGFENAGEFKKAMSGWKGKNLQKKKDQALAFAKGEMDLFKTEAKRLGKLQGARHRGFKDVFKPGLSSHRTAEQASKAANQSAAKIDLFLGEDRTTPVISASKLHGKGYYIYHGGQKVPYTDLSVPFSVLYDASNDKEVIGVDEIIEKGLFTRRGSPFVPWWSEDIDLLELNSFDDAAKLKAARMKDSAKKWGGKAADKLRLGRAKDFVEKNWDDVAIDIYLPGSPGEPRLTASNFNAGVYMDKETSRICATHHDITGAVLIAPHGNVVLTSEEFEKGFLDKEGKKITTSALKRYRNMGKEKVTAAYNKYAKKHVEKYVAKAADGFLALSERWMHGFKATAIDIYAPGSSEPILTAAGFREGKYISTNTKKPITSYLQVDGPLVDNKGNFVLTKEHIEAGVCDKEGKKVTFPRLQSRMGRVLGMLKNAVSIDGAINVGKKLWGKAKNWRGTRDELKDKGKGKWSELGGFAGIKGKLAGNFGKEESEDGTTYRVGSWQWKRKKKEESGWLSRLGSAIRGDKVDEKGRKKKSWLGKILMGVTALGGFIGKKLFGLGGVITGGLTSLASTLLLGFGKSIFGLGKMIVPPILKGLLFLGRKMGGAAFGGGGLGRMAKLGGIAAGGYMMYQGLKGEEQLDENGEPILDAEGKPVTKTDWATTAMGAGTLALSTGVGRAALMGGARLAAGLLTGPVGWAALGATAAWYGGKALMGWWNKGKALEESPMSAFRMIQYGFSPTSEECAKPIAELENYLSGFIADGANINIKPDVDPATIFGFFGLKTDGGDAERNKSFMAWFLGRFKPIYLSYVKQAKKIRNQTDISNLDKELTPNDKLLMLEGVHFKTQSDMNPYNVALSPFADPNSTDYDFEDVASKYETVVENIKDSMTEEEKKAAEATTSPDGKPVEEKSTAGEIIKKTLPAMGIAGASISILGFVSKKMGDIFTKNVDGMGKSIDEQLSRLTKAINEKWTSLKSKVGGAWDSAKDWVSGKVDDVKSGIAGGSAAGGEIAGGAGAVAGGVVGGIAGAAGVVESPDKVYGAGNKSPNIAQVIEVGKGYNIIKTKDGSVIKQTGPWNWRNNNPGNISDGDWARKHGAIDQGKIVGKGSNRFAIFPTYAIGRQAKAALIFEGANYRNINLTDAIARYAPPHENNTANYQRVVLAAVGGVNKPMSSYSNDERIKILNAMEKLEGFKAGSVQVINKGTGPASVGSNNTAQSAAVGANPTGKALLTYGQGGGKMGGAGASGSWETPKVGTMDGGKGAAATSTKPSATSAKPSIASAKPPITSNAGLQGLLAQATPELVQAGKSHVRLGAKRVTLVGMNDTFMTLFWAMVGEAKKKGLGVVQINDGFRSYQEQVRLYNLYKQGKGNLAARPGTSRHGFGQAMDINTVNAEQLIKAGIFAKWGFTRPLLSKKETWHIENKFVPKGKAPNPNIEENKTQNASSGANPQISPNTPSVSNTALTGVMNDGGGASTPGVSAAQTQDSMNSTSVNGILNQQLQVQIQIRDTLSQLMKQAGSAVTDKQKKELEDLKKPSDSSTIGESIGKSIADYIGTKFGVNPNETPTPLARNKPVPPISASK